jgi:hypothetical protein
MKIGTKIMTLAVLTIAALSAGATQAKADGYCREYTRTVLIGGQPQQAYGTACLGPDGAWRVQSEDLSRHQNGLYTTATLNSDNTVYFADQQPVVQQVTYVEPYPVYRPYYRPVYYRPAPVVFGFSFGNGHDHHHWHR